MFKNTYSFLFGLAIVANLTSCDQSSSSDSSSDTAIVALPGSSNANSSTVELATTKIEFTESSFDFGKIDEGKKVEHTFTFKNVGDNPLVIQDARASCGCTVPEYTKDTIAPGSEGKLNVIYNSAGKEGKIDKSVTITANTDPKTTDLKINAFVIKKLDGPFKQ